MFKQRRVIDGSVLHVCRIILPWDASVIKKKPTLVVEARKVVSQTEKLITLASDGKLPDTLTRVNKGALDKLRPRIVDGQIIYDMYSQAPKKRLIAIIKKAVKNDLQNGLNCFKNALTYLSTL